MEARRGELCWMHQWKIRLRQSTSSAAVLSHYHIKISYVHDTTPSYCSTTYSTYPQVDSYILQYLILTAIINLRFQIHHTNTKYLIWPAFTKIRTWRCRSHGEPEAVVDSHSCSVPFLPCPHQQERDGLISRPRKPLLPATRSYLNLISPYNRRRELWAM